MGGAIQNVVGVTVGTTVDVVMAVGDCDDVSASCARPFPNWQLVGAACPHVPIHHVGTPDGGVVVNDVSHDVQDPAQAFHNNDHDNNCHGMAEEVGTIHAVDISQESMILVDNGRVGGEVGRDDEVQE